MVSICIRGIARRMEPRRPQRCTDVSADDSSSFPSRRSSFPLTTIRRSSFTEPASFQCHCHQLLRSSKGSPRPRTRLGRSYTDRFKAGRTTLCRWQRVGNQESPRTTHLAVIKTPTLIWSGKEIPEVPKHHTELRCAIVKVTFEGVKDKERGGWAFRAVESFETARPRQEVVLMSIIREFLSLEKISTRRIQNQVLRSWNDNRRKCKKKNEK